MSWARLAEFVLRRARLVMVGSLVLLALPTLALPSMAVTYNVLSELPPEADSVEGFDTLSRSFAPGQVQPLVMVIESDDPIWNDDDFQAIDDLTVNLRKLDAVSSVRSITRPTGGGAATAADIEAAGLGDLANFPAEARRGTRGLARAIDGLERIRGGLRTIDARLPELDAGLDEARAGVARMRDGVAQIRDGLSDGAAGLRALASDVAEPAERNLERAWADLKAATVAKLDPLYADLAQRVGTALALVSGRCPDARGIGIPPLFPAEQPCRPGEPVQPGYDGLAPTLREGAAGLDRAVVGLGQIDDGLRRLAEGLLEGAPGIGRLRDGIERMIEGLDLIIPGLRQLHQGLVVGLAQAEKAGLLPDAGKELALTATLVNAFPKLKRQLQFFVGDGGRATRVFVTLDRPPYEARSLDASHRVREVAELSLSNTSLEDADMTLTGASAFFADVRQLQESDFRRIMWVVVFGIFLVLAALLRSLVAPGYLILTVLLSFASTLGLTSLVFEGLLGKEGIVWWLPPFLFVILVALGADYNIFLTSRIREEAERAESREAVAKGLALTGGVITSAGLILAGTFAALLFAPLDGLVQVGFATSVGILIDTFVVRSLLVPSIAVQFGRHNWWPSARARRA